MPVVIFTVKTNAYVTVLYYRESNGDRIRIELNGGVGRKDFPAGSDQVASLFLHGSLNSTADFTIEQEAASGNILLAERPGIVVTDESGITVEVPFRVADPACT